MSKRSRRTATTTPPPPTPGFLARLPARRKTLLCLGLLLALSLAFFAPIHFGGKTIVAGDTTSFLASGEAMFNYTAETGRPALWAPNVFSGMPGYLIWYPLRVPQLDSLLSALREFAWPTSHLIALLGGMFWFAFRLTRNRWASMLAAVSYGLTTYLPVILLAGHNTKFIALCLAPWLMLAFHYALERPRPLAGLLFAAAAAANLRAGHVQITYYFLFVMLIWWIVEGIRAYRSGTNRSFGSSTLLLLLGGGAALLMSAQPWLATFEYKAFTVRGATAGGESGGFLWDRAMAWSQGTGELLTLLVANAFGGSGAEYWGPKTSTAGPHYIGGGVIALALFAAITVRKSAVIALSIATVVLTLFALGENFGLLNRPMFAYFPLFDAFRAPETWLAAVAFALAALSAVGLARALDSDWRMFIRVAGAVAGFVLVLLIAKGGILSFEKPGEFDALANQLAAQQQVQADDPRVAQAVNNYLSTLADTRAELFTADAVRTVVALLVVLAILILARRGKLDRDIATLLVVAVVTIDLFGVGRRYVGADTLVDKASVEQRVPTYDFDDYLSGRVAEAGGPGHFRVLSLEAQPATNARPSYAYESVGGYHGAKLRNYEDYLENVLFVNGVASPNRNGLALLGVRFVVGQSPPRGFESVFQSQTGLTVFERTTPFPRARLVGSAVVETDPNRVWQTIVEAPDAEDLALVEAPLSTTLVPADSSSQVAVELEHYDPRLIRWQVETDAPRLLVTGEVYYPAGWIADVDGAETPIIEVNGLFRGVVVPAGEHTVEMRFEPAADRIGYLIALFSTILVYGGIVWLLVKRT